MAYQSQNSLGIWNNHTCTNCGACCYDFKTSNGGNPCPHQEIKHGKSRCSIHDSKERSKLCQLFSCSQLMQDPVLITRAENYRLIALYDLRTVQDVDLLKNPEA
jgi:hypothetical protein